MEGGAAQAEAQEFAALASARAAAKAAQSLREEVADTVAANSDAIVVPPERSYASPFSKKPPAISAPTEAAGSEIPPFSPLKDASIEERMRRMALKATSEMASKTKNKKQKGMYSEKNLRKRLELMDHPGILALLERLWVSANTDASDAIIDHDEYIVMHRKSERHSLISISSPSLHTRALSTRPSMPPLTHIPIVVRACAAVLLALDPTTPPSAALRQAEGDWKTDSDGMPGLDRAAFYWTWFELADMYTTSIDAVEYCTFLDRMRSAIITEDIYTGATVWQDDRKIIE